MSTSPEHGLPKVMDAAIRAGKAELRADAQMLQVDFLDEPMTSQEVLEARERLGPHAGTLAIARDVKASRGGRPKGARNRATGDLVNYLRQFGPDPLVAAMKIMAEPEEFIVERSRLVDPAKKQLSIGEARAHRMRMIELLAPYFHGKKPVQVQIDATGDFNLLIPGINISAEDARKAGDGQFVLEADYTDIDEGEANG